MFDKVTHEELAEWCAKGKGVWKHEPSDLGDVYSTYKFNEIEADMPILIDKDGRNILVRKWNDREWHQLSRKYMGLKKIKVSPEKGIQH